MLSSKVLTVGWAASRALSGLASAAGRPASHSETRTRATFGSISLGAVTIRPASGAPTPRALAPTAGLRTTFLPAAFFLAGGPIPHLYRPFARQRNDGFEARMVVLQRQFAAMQPRHRRGEAQAEPRARFRAALLEPDEPFDHA